MVSRRPGFSLWSRLGIDMTSLEKLMLKKIKDNHYGDWDLLLCGSAIRHKTKRDKLRPPACPLVVLGVLSTNSCPVPAGLEHIAAAADGPLNPLRYKLLEACGL